MDRDFRINLFLAAVLVGVAVGGRVMGDALFWYVGLLMLVILGLFIWRLKMGLRKAAVILLMMGFCIGVGRVMVDWVVDWPLMNVKLYGSKVELEGIVDNMPVNDGVEQQFYLTVKKVLVQAKSEEVVVPDGFLVRVKLAAFPQLHLRDQVRIVGTMLTPENSDGFNYADYLMKDHVYWLLTSAGLKAIVQTAEFRWWSLEDELFWLRGVFLEQTYRLFVEPAGGIMAGTLIGDRADIADFILANFQVTGLTHILAISGFNISLIINLISLLVARRGKWERFCVTMSLIVAFVIITGAGASVLRAAMMGALVLAVRTFGRSSQILKIILLSGVVMALMNPRIVDFDISFQLSFFATMSLIVYADEVADLWKIVKKEEWRLTKSQLFWQGVREFLKDGIMTTIAAQVMTLPIIFYSFGTVSLISPIANLVVGPLVPLIMLFGFMAVVASFLSFGLGCLIGGLGSLAVGAMLKIVELFAKFPLASIELGKGQVWLAIVYYLLVFRLFHKYKPEPGFSREPVLLP